MMTIEEIRTRIQQAEREAAAARAEGATERAADFDRVAANWRASLYARPDAPPDPRGAALFDDDGVRAWAEGPKVLPGPGVPGAAHVVIQALPQARRKTSAQRFVEGLAFVGAAAIVWRVLR